MQEPKIGIIGAGKLSTRRIYPYIGAAGGQIRAVCDLDQEKAAQNARRFGGTVYNDYEKMLENEELDGVIVCVGPGQHAAISAEMMRRGIPVYTEKPPAPTADEAFELAKLSKETGVLCTTAFKKRYASAFVKAKQWLSKYNSEDYFSISMDYCSGQYPNESPRTSFLLDFAIHHIDLVTYLFGDVKEVFSYSKGLDAYAISMQFEHGGVGSFNFNCGRSFSVPTEEVELTVRGGNFMTIHNSSGWRITEDGKPLDWREPPTFVSGGDSGYDTGHLAEIEDYFQALAEKRTTRSNIYESYKSMVLYEAIEQSVNSKSPVQVQYRSL